MIAYVNIDTLVSKYNFYKDLQAEYESKAKKADDELSSKGRSLQNDVQDFQNKIDKGLVTRSEAATMQENLEKKQQDFLSHRDKVMSELAEEEQVMLNKIHYNITEYLKKFNEGYRFKRAISEYVGRRPDLERRSRIGYHEHCFGRTEQRVCSRKSYSRFRQSRRKEIDKKLNLNFTLENSGTRMFRSFLFIRIRAQLCRPSIFNSPFFSFTLQIEPQRKCVVNSLYI